MHKTLTIVAVLAVLSGCTRTVAQRLETQGRLVQGIPYDTRLVVVATPDLKRETNREGDWVYDVTLEVAIPKERGDRVSVRPFSDIFNRDNPLYYRIYIYDVSLDVAADFTELGVVTRGGQFYCATIQLVHHEGGEVGKPLAPGVVEKWGVPRIGHVGGGVIYISGNDGIRRHLRVLQPVKTPPIQWPRQPQGI